ncbi:tetratricopeptide repeat protein [Helicobacter felis]|uniref:tetratricopeptide repeat protein n=1 Tax=Helicobacter felis TaxID=214 RepID=UPI000CEE3DA4|nr:tetratricopeptide repeat protein [Helicobacter felis]
MMSLNIVLRGLLGLLLCVLWLEGADSTPTPPSQNAQEPPVPPPTPPKNPPTLQQPPATPPMTDRLTPPAMAQDALSAGITAVKRGDYKSAFRLFVQSCDQGNPAGCFAVGTMYSNGVGIQVDMDKAQRYYELGCSGGDASACADLAQVYDSKKQATLDDKEKAAQLYAVGCSGGDVLACNNLGWMYANGVGVPKNYYKAIEYYKYACEHGSDLGCYNLGLMSNVKNIYGFNKAQLSNVDLNYLACNAGDIQGCANLGWIYAKGEQGVPVNNFFAAKYFEKACQGGNLSGCNNLGVLYQKGLGVPQNDQRALDLFSYVCNYGLQSGCDNYSLFKEKLLKANPNYGRLFMSLER